MQIKPAPDRPGINDCCKIIENLKAILNESQGTAQTRCNVCGKNHYRIIAEPGIIGSQGSSLGA